MCSELSQKGLDGTSLRYRVGDKVACLLSCDYTECGQIACKDAPREWALGLVVATSYLDASGETFPYLVELIDTGDLHRVPSDTECQCTGVDRAWWLPILDPPEDSLRRTFDAPGPYMVVSNTFAGTAADRTAAEKVDGSDLRASDLVEVVEVASVADRVRGRLLEPEGAWISLRSCDDSRVFAVPANSAYARLWRQFNAKYFEDPWTANAGVAYLRGSGGSGGRLEPDLEGLRRRAEAADLDRRDEFGRTALSLSLHRGWTRAAAALLELRALPDAEDGQGWRPLHHAAKAGAAAGVRLLLEAAAEPSPQDRSPEELSGRKSRSRPAQAAHRTPLHYSAERGDLQSALALLERRAGADVRDAEGKTALHLALEEEQGGVVDALLEHGADANLLLDGWSPLMRAAYAGDTEVGQRLIAARADLDLLGAGQLTAGMTALHLAVRRSRLDFAQLLVRSRCDAGVLAGGRTALDLAPKEKREAFSRILCGT